MKTRFALSIVMALLATDASQAQFADALPSPGAVAGGVIGGAIIGKACKKHKFKCGALAAGIGGAIILKKMHDRASETTDVPDDPECHKDIYLAHSRAPTAIEHIADAISAGYPRTLTYDGDDKRNRSRRKQATKGHPSIAGRENDEYPPASFFEGGAGASVRNIPKEDNRVAGGIMGKQLVGVPQGCKITFNLVP